MIGWLTPWALYGLAILAAPILIHLLRTQRAPRVPFPTLRFVKAARSRAARPRVPSDPWLLLLRLAILTALVGAAARPLFLFPARVSAWDARLSRAVVVASEPSPEVEAAAATELAGAFDARRIPAEDLGEGLVRAAAWLSSAAPSRREIVVVGPVAAGAIDGRLVTQVPAGIGLRFATVGGPPPGPREVAGGRLLDATGLPPREQRWRLDGASTAAVYEELTGDVTAVPGLTLVVAAEDRAQVEALRRAVAISGAAAPAAEQPLIVRFRGADPIAGVGPLQERWMVETVLRLSGDQELARAVEEVPDGEATGARPSGAGGSAAADWVTVIDGARPQPAIRAAAAAGSLVLDTDLAAGGFAAAVTVRAALTARRGDVARPQIEVLRAPAAQLTAWSRPAGEVTPDAWTRAGTSDARWLWALVAVLMVAEQWLRRRASTVKELARAA